MEQNKSVSLKGVAALVVIEDQKFYPVINAGAFTANGWVLAISRLVREITTSWCYREKDRGDDGLVRHWHAAWCDVLWACKTALKTLDEPQDPGPVVEQINFGLADVALVVAARKKIEDGEFDRDSWHLRANFSGQERGQILSHLVKGLASELARDRREVFLKGMLQELEELGEDCFRILEPWRYDDTPDDDALAERVEAQEGD